MIMPYAMPDEMYAAAPGWPPQRRLAPVAGQLLKNFLFKTIGYFDCDYAAFVHESARARNQVFFTIATRERMHEERLEMVRGMFLLPFFCNAPRPGRDADIITIEHYTSESAGTEQENPDSAGDYRYLHLVNSDSVRGLAGIGCFAPGSMRGKSAEWSEYSQFLHCSGSALLQRL